MNITIQKHSLRLDTAKYTLEDVKKEIQEDFQILISLGYTDLAQKKVRVEWSKALKQYGSCSKPSSSTYIIKINQNFIRVADYKEVHNTIMHECIHCIEGCFNHGPNWKKAAAKVNAKFDFTPIERCGTDDNYSEFLKGQAKYQITCKACHHTWNYYRKTRIFASCANGRATCSCGSREFDCKTLK